MNERQVEFETLRIELDQKTDYAQIKKNRINRTIKGLRVGLSSSPNVIMYAKFKEGDEITLWPGRIINLSTPSEGLMLRWEGQVNEWVELELSNSAPFVSGDYRPLEFDTSVSPESYRKNLYMMSDTAALQIMASNETRVYAEIKNPHPRPIFIGTLEDCNPADGLRYQKAIRILPFGKKRIEHTGELYAIADTAFSGIDNYHRIEVLEFLK